MRTRFEQIVATRQTHEGTVLSEQQKARVEESGQSIIGYEFISYTMKESDAASLGLNNCTLYLLDSTMVMPGRYLHICTGLGSKSKVSFRDLLFKVIFMGFIQFGIIHSYYTVN